MQGTSSLGGASSGGVDGLDDLVQGTSSSRTQKYSWFLLWQTAVAAAGRESKKRKKKLATVSEADPGQLLAFELIDNASP